MTFTVIRTEDPQWETAPWQVLKNNEVFLDGLQLETEAREICRLLNQPQPKIIPIRKPRFTPRLIAASQLQDTRKFLSQLKPKDGAS